MGDFYEALVQERTTASLCPEHLLGEWIVDYAGHYFAVSGMGD